MYAAIAIVVPCFFGLVGSRDAQTIPGVAFGTEKPVYKIDSAEPVRFTLMNGGSKAIYMSNSAPWVVEGDGVYAFPLFGIIGITVIHPGSSMTWSWNKKSKGVAVPPGSYTIKVKPIHLIGSDQLYSLSCTVPLTLSGKLAGSNFFPLSVGNTWLYEGPLWTSFVTMTVDEVSKGFGGTGWFRVTNLLDQPMWVKQLGAKKTALWATQNPSKSNLVPPQVLFRFNYSLGTVHSFGSAKITVAGKNETVVTPAGRFNGCYRVKVQGAPYGTRILWFAPGIGLVQYQVKDMGSMITYRLRYATIQGSDGYFYNLGS